MQLRQLYERFLHLPASPAGVKYETALQLWERHTHNPLAADLTAASIEAFRMSCAGAGMVEPGFNGCWRYLLSILRTASDNGIVIPYIRTQDGAVRET